MQSAVKSYSVSTLRIRQEAARPFERWVRSGSEQLE